MKNNYIVSAFLLLSGLLGVNAGERFQSGQIWYEILSEEDATVAIVPEKENNPDNYADLSGHIDIPSNVEYQSKQYNVKVIGHDAFKKCVTMTSVTIPTSVTNIEHSAFKNCSQLVTIDVPESVTVIGAYAFGGTAWIEYLPDGLIYAGKVAYKYKGKLAQKTRIDIQAGTVAIAGDAFSNCRNLTTVGIPNTVTNIGPLAFRNCSEMTSVVIPESVTFIGDAAFTGCTGLSSITIPETVTKVGHNAFTGTSWLKKQPDGMIYTGKVAYKYKGEMPVNMHVQIKDGTKTISGEAFMGCDNLIAIEIPNSVDYIGVRTFHGCVGLTEVTLPSTIKAINTETFFGCTGLKTMNVPNSVKEIDLSAFENCESLTTIDIPSSVVKIEDRAFAGDVKLSEINVANATPPTLGTDVFSAANDVIFQNAQLNVPIGAASSYKSAEGWSQFKNVAEKNIGGVNDVAADGVKVYAVAGKLVIDGEGVAEVFTVGGQCIYCGNDRQIALQSGLYIVRVAGKTFKIGL